MVSHRLPGCIHLWWVTRETDCIEMYRSSIPSLRGIWWLCRWQGFSSAKKTRTFPLRPPIFSASFGLIQLLLLANCSTVQPRGIRIWVLLFWPNDTRLNHETQMHHKCIIRVRHVVCKQWPTLVPQFHLSFSCPSFCNFAMLERKQQTQTTPQSFLGAMLLVTPFVCVCVDVCYRYCLFSWFIHVIAAFLLLLFFHVWKNQWETFERINSSIYWTSDKPIQNLSTFIFHG